MSYGEVTLEQVGPESDATGVLIKKGHVATDTHTGECHVRVGGMVPQAKGLTEARGQAATVPSRGPLENMRMALRRLDHGLLVSRTVRQSVPAA